MLEDLTAAIDVEFGSFGEKALGPGQMDARARLGIGAGQIQVGMLAIARSSDGWLRVRVSDSGHLSRTQMVFFLITH